MTAEINYGRCTGCGKCYEVCPLDIMAWDKTKDRPVNAYPRECQLCFICQEECPEDAIEVKIPIIFW